MDRGSKHLNSEERGVIFAEYQRGNSHRGIGRLLGRPASTICRELARARQENGGYCPQTARRVYDERRARCRPKRKLVEGSDLHRFVHGKLVHLRWSAEQIAYRLRSMKPDDPSAHVSHESIYAAIYAQPRGGLKEAMIKALRHSKPKRGHKRTTVAGTSMVPETLHIINRPEELEARLVPGHWEADLIKGAFNRSSVGTLVGRKTRFVILQRRRGSAGKLLRADETSARRPAQEHDLRPGIRDGVSSRTRPTAEDRRLVLRSSCPLAARLEREHQRTAAPVHAQRERPRKPEPDMAERRSKPHEQPSEENSRLENTRRSHGPRNCGLQINRCT